MNATIYLSLALAGTQLQSYDGSGHELQGTALQMGLIANYVQLYKSVWSFGNGGAKTIANSQIAAFYKTNFYCSTTLVPLILNIATTNDYIHRTYNRALKLSPHLFQPLSSPVR